MKNKNLKAFLNACTAFLLIFFTACGGDDDNPTPTVETSNGFYIVNEGPFGSGTGTVSYYDRTTKTVKNDLFGAANGTAALGNVLQSLTFFQGKAYCVVNNANRIIVADSATFKFQDSLTGFVLPRYILPVSNQKMYVSEWGTNGIDGSVKVYDPATKKLIQTIKTGKGAGRILSVSNGAWVVNDGGFSSDSSVVFINSSEALTQKIEVGLNPNSLIQDANGDIWVLCGGAYNADFTAIRKPAELILIKNNKVESRQIVQFNSSKLVTNSAKNRLYFVGGGKIWEKDLTTAPPSVFLEKPTASVSFGSLYGLGFDAKTQNLVCGDAKSFSSNGTMYIFNTTSKSLVDSAKVGIGPNGFVF